MTTAHTEHPSLMQRPKRADALRNYEKLLAAARAAFTEDDSHASLEDIARRAGVGIGTLYRHFPTRQNLIEAVYVDEVEALSRSAVDVAELPPWDALVDWLRRFVGYVATKQALAEELFAYAGPNPEVFATCRSSLYAAGGPLLERAQRAGFVRDDVDISDVLHLVSGIAKTSTPDPGQGDRLLEIALDGLRRSASGASAT
jgi:AcrR family transcriptional regulator